MAHKAPDVVVLVMKSRDGKTVNRVNAIVLHSRVQPDGAEKLSPKEVEKQRLLKGPMGKPIAGGEYLDVAYPDPALSSINGGEQISSRDAGVIFRFAYTVPKYTKGAAIGWDEYQSAPFDAPIVETKHYADGSSATGVAPLPDQSPDEQAAGEQPQDDTQQ